eukprot:CAMPEP_0167746950 /NCGR_PEP_ID=MMETSP0110_2-20121227/4000_1 /TAXON_ID=629695 /ORGANISM="Gymnochlora sp., Strain CCMP2014" /LENGTH=502 /DNA_ID=CAMNT_0007631777 /DNA_START=418 /DNA_END=1922 /DNA_ORIENTATION=+
MADRGYGYAYDSPNRQPSHNSYSSQYKYRRDDPRVMRGQQQRRSGARDQPQRSSSRSPAPRSYGIESLAPRSPTYDSEEGDGRSYNSRRYDPSPSRRHQTPSRRSPAPTHSSHHSSRVQSAEPSNRDSVEKQLIRRIQSLEEQLKLVRHQQRLFISFMQTANQKFIALESEMRNMKANTARNSGRSEPELNSFHDYNSVNSREDSFGVRKSSKPSSGKNSARNRWREASEFAQKYEQEQMHEKEEENERVIARERDERQRLEKKEKRRLEQEERRRLEQKERQRLEREERELAEKRRATNEASPSYDYEEEEDDEFENNYDALTKPKGNNMYESPPSQIPGGPGGVGDAEEPDPYAPPVETKPCPFCGRRFRPEVLKRHLKLKICQKKRKQYKVKRVEEKVRKDRKAERKFEAAKRQAKSKPKWKKDRDAFRDAMKQARIVRKALKEGKDLRDLPPPPSRPVEDDRTPCPHCGRRFNADVAARHIPKCKNIRAKPKRLVSKR